MFYTFTTKCFVINRNLTLRDLGAEVTKLQSLLAKDTSLYPEGLVTGYFGSLTKKAVQRFQCRYSIVCSGTPETTGYGNVGLNTRLKMEEVFGGTKPDNTQSNTNTSTRNQNAAINFRSGINNTRIPKFRSCNAIATKRTYKRCSTECSAPPI